MGGIVNDSVRSRSDVVHFKFILEFTESDEWRSNRWFSEEHCQVENQASPTTAVICSTSGYHPFGILDHSATKLVTVFYKSYA